MKTLLFSILALLSITANAQDKSTIQTMANASSVEELRTVSDKIASSAGQKFTFYKIGARSLRDEKYKTVIYTPADMTEADKAEFTAEEKERCLIVVWKDNGGSYTFSEVYSDPKNIMPFWNATFKASETEYRVAPELKYKLVGNEKTASIVKSY